MKRSACLFLKLIPLLLLLQFSYAEDINKKGLDISGRLFNDIVIRQYTNSITNDFHYAGQNILRLNAVNVDHNFAKIEGSADFTFYSGEYADLFRNAAASNPTLVSGSGSVLTLNVRKLYLALYPEFADFTVGRQIINYGVGYLFSPIDVFSAVDLSDMNFTRTGSDIARVQIPIGNMGGIDMVASPSTQISNSVVSGKIFANLLGYDFSTVGIVNGKDRETTAGLTFKGDAVVGVHGELVEHFFDQSTNNFFEGMAGIDYSFFENKLVLLAEYYYNDKPVDPNTVTITNVLTITRPFYNRHYLFFQGQVVIDEIRQAGLSWIFNPLDQASLVIAQYTQNIFQNANLTAYVRYYDKNLNGLKWAVSPLFDYALRLEVIF